MSKKAKHAINWFEIPVKDFARASKFYSAILGEKVEKMEWNGATMGFLPADEGAVTGCIIQADGYAPSDKGSLVYLNGGADLSVPLAKVEKAGGKVLLPKTDIGEYGYIARFRDTEGNLVAFHSGK
jgi:predicted enzyme related to lactoylglutathione lyase